MPTTRTRLVTAGGPHDQEHRSEHAGVVSLLLVPGQELAEEAAPGRGWAASSTSPNQGDRVGERAVVLLREDPHDDDLGGHPDDHRGPATEDQQRGAAHVALPQRAQSFRRPRPRPAPVAASLPRTLPNQRVDVVRPSRHSPGPAPTARNASASQIEGLTARCGGADRRVYRRLRGQGALATSG